MADVIEIPGGNKAVKLPVAENDFGKVHTFSVPLKNGDVPTCAVAILENETSETILAHIRPGHGAKFRLGAKTLFARSATPSGLIVEAEKPPLIAPAPA